MQTQSTLITEKAGPSEPSVHTSHTHSITFHNTSKIRFLRDQQTPKFIRGSAAALTQTPKFNRGSAAALTQNPKFNSAAALTQNPKFNRGSAAVLTQNPKFTRASAAVLTQNPKFTRASAAVLTQNPKFIRGSAAALSVTIMTSHTANLRFYSRQVRYFLFVSTFQLTLKHNKSPI
jgi:hypothetical protein